ncbi:four-carbon acid sugar kinase family protein [Spirosoma validum]|uniref:Four-carbon acid sugar kinase family protein n=1 Tax=Spirosoma validum TaxID=2771355 RepID=A0A927GDV8_9BACT|nr:four-carbon acid sugar kinase family protein [Spirosoma validum]MBD2754134.1 four-carbon acid sugar kinase family protein [Spirosoma validum]
MSISLALAYYGDDFTGSTDALEFLSRAGLKTALFIEPPTPERLATYSNLDAIGVAGLTRSMAPDVMEQTLRTAFVELRQLGTRHVHYKVCSTFDSSPIVGSIGKAIDVGQEIFQKSFIPLLVAAPSLGRYCVFGNLFARMGIGSAGTIYRLDRHPSMSKHPVTPADESDLRLHLAKQTTKKAGLLDILQVVKSQESIQNAVTSLLQDNAEIILFDALYEEHLLPIGELMDSYGHPQNPLFLVGSSGVEMALGKYWAKKGDLQPVTSWPNPGKASPLLVLAGSCSPVTSGQIVWAKANGFSEIVLDAQQIHDHATLGAGLSDYVQKAIDQIRQERSVIVHTAGSSAQQGITLSSEKLGTALGLIAKEVVRQTSVKRVVVAGGDTSSYAARAMGIEAVEMIAPLVPGAPLCKATAPGSSLDGVEVNVKGGQVGAEDYFGVLLEGRVF